MRMRIMVATTAVLVLISARAGAQPGHDGAAQAGPSASEGARSSPVVEPRPGREQSTESEQQAASAAPHAIEPSPGDPAGPAFRLYVEYDLPVLGIGLVFAAARLVLSQRAYCAPLCERDDLNRLDRVTAGFYSPGWRLSSNVALYSMVAGAALYLALDEGIFNALNDGVVIAESALAALAVASIMAVAANRPRPLLYGESAPLSERNSSDAAFSLFSSHAAVAFATATATWMAARRLHPRSKLPVVVASAGAALAALVAAARVLAGMHFITDAAGGAIIGMSLGVLVPALHRSGVSVVPSQSANARGLALVMRF